MKQVTWSIEQGRPEKYLNLFLKVDLEEKINLVTNCHNCLTKIYEQTIVLQMIVFSINTSKTCNNLLQFTVKWYFIGKTYYTIIDYNVIIEVLAEENI